MSLGIKPMEEDGMIETIVRLLYVNGESGMMNG